MTISLTIPVAGYLLAITVNIDKANFVNTKKHIL